MLPLMSSKDECRDPAKYETWEPMWEYKQDGQWELYFIDTEGFVQIKPLGDRKGVALKPAVKLKLNKGGMVVRGLEPE